MLSSRLAQLVVVCASLFASARMAAQPDNDLFQHRVVLSGISATLEAYNLDATTEPGEPNHANSPGQSEDSSWWTWTAPGDGFLELVDPAGESGFALYTGDRVDSLTLVHRAAGGRVRPFPVQAKQSFQIAVSSEIASPHTRAVRLTLHPIPMNDHFAQRTRAFGDSLELRGNTVGATRESGEPAHGLEPLQSPSVWWEWKPEESGRVAVSSPGDSHARLIVYRGDRLEHLVRVNLSEEGDAFSVTGGEVYQLAVIPASEDGSGPFVFQLQRSRLRLVEPVPGTRFAETGSFQIRLAGGPTNALRTVVVGRFGETQTFEGIPDSITWTNTFVGKTTLQVRVEAWDGSLHLAEPVTVSVHEASDAFAEATVISKSDDRLAIDFISASLESGEPPVPEGVSGTAWLRWTAPADGVIWFWDSPNTSTITEVFTGSELGSLRPVSYEDDGQMVRTRKGVTYHFRKWSLLPPADQPEFALHSFTFRQSVATDTFAARQILRGTSLDIPLPPARLTCESGEPPPCDVDRGSRWFEWVAPGTGELSLRLVEPGSLTPGTIDLFRGTSLSNLVGGSQFASSVLNTPVVKGERYYVRLRQSWRIFEPSPVNLILEFTPAPQPPSNDAFALPQRLEGESGELLVSNDGATTEVGERTGVASLWFEWIAPANGVFLVDYQGLLVDWPTLWSPRLRFWSGTGLANQVAVANQEAAPGRAALPVTPGQLCRFTLTESPGTPSQIQLRYLFVPRTTNDSFAGRTVLTGTRVTTSGWNWTATAEGSDPSLDGKRLPRTLWWEWTAPVSGFLHVRSTTSLAAVFRGTDLTALQLIGSSTAPTLPSGGVFAPVQAGEVYQILTAHDSTTGALVSRYAPFALELDLTSLAPATPGADSVGWSPLHLALQPINPSLDGDVVDVTWVRLTNNFFRSGPLDLGQSFRSPEFGLSDVAVPPADHLIQARATNAAGAVRWSAPVFIRVAPANDDITNAMVLSGRTLAVPFSTSGASRAVSDPPPGGSNNVTVWFRWQPEAAGSTRLEVSPALRPDLRVYSGNSPTALEPVPLLAGPLGATNLSFHASPTNVYWIQVGSGEGPRPKLYGLSIVETLRLALTTTVLSLPESNARFEFGAPVRLRAETTESPSALTGIEFLANGQPLGVATSPPYEFVWNGPPPGRHDVGARALLQKGDTAQTGVRRIFVGPPNDSFGNRQGVPPAQRLITGTLAGASPDDGKPGAAGDVWFTWRAPDDGLLRLIGEGSVQEVKVFTGENFGDLELIPKRLGPDLPTRLGDWVVRSGEEYHLAVSSFQTLVSGQSFAIQLELHRAASNDTFANRLALEGTSGEVDASLVLATLEPGEPTFPDAVSSVWWSWNSPEDGFLELSLVGESNWQGQVHPFLGETLSTLSPMIPEDGQFGTPLYRVRAGQAVRFSLTAPFDHIANLRWRWRLHPLPANDSFQHAIALSGRSLVVEGTTLGATREVSDPTVFPESTRTVWYTWTAPADGEADVWLDNLQNLHGLTVFRDTPVSESGSELPSTLKVRAGDALRFMVRSLNEPPGPFTLRLVLHQQPKNDSFGARQRLTGSTTWASGSNRLSTRERGEPRHGGAWGGRSVWYAWRAPASGTVVAEASGSISTPILAIYQGTGVSELESVAAGVAEHEFGRARATFRAEAGQDYLIAVDGALATTGEFQLGLTLVDPPTTPRLTYFVGEDSDLLIVQVPPGVWRLETSSNTLLDWALISDQLEEEVTQWNIPKENISIYARFFRVAPVESPISDE